MPRRRGSEGDRQVLPRGPRGRGRIVGVATAAAAFLAFGVTPLFSAPPARADAFDLIIDPIINSLSSLDPTLGADLGALAISIDPSFALENAAALAEPATAAGSTTSADLASSYAFAPLETAEQAWIASPTGEQIDNFLNTTFGEFLIGNGAPGTEADPTGGAGGLLFGDGGAGWNSTEVGVAGGNGGDAGFLGDGGLGGAGGAGADGGDGGDGGSLIGIGGDGGNAGSGATTSGLPALGGAGGNAGAFGEHGAVGDFGTLGAGTSPTPDADGSLLPVTTTGDYLTNSDGQVVLLHGLNEVYKEAPYEPASDGFSNDDAEFLAANGFNVVRVGVIWSELEPEPGVFNSSYLDSIESTVNTLGNNGIYSILDFHQDAYSTAFGGEGAPDWAVQTDGATNTEQTFPLNEFFNPDEQSAWQSFWTNTDVSNGTGLEDDYSQMLEYVANAFNGNPDVTGIEVMNEPSPGVSTFLSTLLGGSFFDSQQLTPFYDQAADAIRSVDPTTPIFYEPNVLFDATVPTHLGTVEATNTVFSFHGYCEIDFGSSCLPSTANITDALTYANAQGIPAFMTEFGNLNGSASDTTDTLASELDANQNMVGWTEWAYTGQGDVTGSPNSEWLINNPELPPTGDNVNTAALQALAEPYPQEVSGTPDSFSFTNGTFQFSYSTQEADGLGSFPAGSQTTISVPTVEFPNGYDVSVTGGQVVSGPDAPELVIASDNGANTVTVTVTAAGGA
jgi:endoglycosylceramidase